MAALKRTEACGFSIASSHSVSEIEAMSQEERLSLLSPTVKLFSTLPAINLSPFYERLFRSGCAIQQKKLKCDFPLSQRLRIYGANGEFFALGEVVEDAEGLAVKSVKLFVL